MTDSPTIPDTDFLTDSETDMASGWMDYQEVFDQLQDIEVASLNDTPPLLTLNWELPE